ncbi:MAG: 16S rRNA (cytidine(1402)-2'-O)-methyltransferase [Anaerolineae bacterium]|nr:16S rRNA (cytidine(1402)-2'-O)-methyltransferase [Anaerolineae bacterium]MDQ7033775.1 16S rRNA (cytidine(1402)-2'-O)-methyltransferase [Anaerolineae bacterium]
MGTLYVVATPIGNLEDMTFRAVRILKDVHLIAAEDTRTSRVLVQHFGIETPMTSYHEHNKLGKLDSIFDTLLTNDVALISDAGTPTISDPGYELVREAIKRDIEVVPIPGASAIITALVASGMATDSFVYLGFLPKKQNARRNLLQSLKNEKRTIVAYESPHRAADTLALVASIMGDERSVCVAREMTKLFEQFWRGTALDATQHFSAENPKGEITLIIGGSPTNGQWDKAQVQAELQKKLDEGESLSRAAKAIAALSGWKKSAVYDVGLED